MISQYDDVDNITTTDEDTGNESIDSPVYNDDNVIDENPVPETTETESSTGDDTTDAVVITLEPDDDYDDGTYIVIPLYYVEKAEKIPRDVQTSFDDYELPLETSIQRDIQDYGLPLETSIQRDVEIEVKAKFGHVIDGLDIQAPTNRNVLKDEDESAENNKVERNIIRTVEAKSPVEFRYNVDTTILLSPTSREVQGYVDEDTLYPTERTVSRTVTDGLFDSKLTIQRNVASTAWTFRKSKKVHPFKANVKVKRTVELKNDTHYNHNQDTFVSETHTKFAKVNIEQLEIPVKTIIQRSVELSNDTKNNFNIDGQNLELPQKFEIVRTLKHEDSALKTEISRNIELPLAGKYERILECKLYNNVISSTTNTLEDQNFIISRNVIQDANAEPIDLKLSVIKQARTYDAAKRVIQKDVEHLAPVQRTLFLGGKIAVEPRFDSRRFIAKDKEIEFDLCIFRPKKEEAKLEINTENLNDDFVDAEISTTPANTTITKAEQIKSNIASPITKINSKRVVYIPFSEEYTNPRNIIKKEYIKILMHFNNENNVVEDEGGNHWIINGEPIITEDHAKFNKAIQFADNASYLTCSRFLDLGGQDFTLDFWAYIDSESSTNNMITSIFNVDIEEYTFAIERWYQDSTKLRWYINNTVRSFSIDTSVMDSLHHYAMVYHHNDSICEFYVDGKKVASVTDTIPRAQQKITLGYAGFSGSIDEYRIVDGLASWSTNFNIPEKPYVVLEAS